MVFFLVEKSAIGISTVLSKVNTNFLAALKFFFSHLIPMCNSFFLFWVLPRELTGHSKHPLPTTQEKTLHMDITRCQHWNQIDNILCSQTWRSSIQSAKIRLGADCDSDHELLIAKFRLKSKIVGKTTRPFRYDLNQIPYDYTVEVTNRFKGLDLIEWRKNYGPRFVTLYRRQWSRSSLRKRKINPFECRAPKNSKER